MITSRRYRILRHLTYGSAQPVIHASVTATDPEAALRTVGYPSDRRVVQWAQEVPSVWKRLREWWTGRIS